MKKRPIFYDYTGKRWKWIIRGGLAIFIGVYTFALFSVMHVFFTNTVHPMTRSVLFGLGYISMAFLFFSLFIGIVRLLLLMYFSWRQKRTRNRMFRGHVNYTPSVSVVIPAYNEEVGIKKTIRTVLKSHYPVHEVIVVDDGSTDKTAKIVKRRFRRNRRVMLISKNNGGKASALNVGFKKATGEIVVTIDADNILLKDTISHLVSHFYDPNVAVVSGNCKIGNLDRQLPIWQHIEYVTANNLEKRTLDYLNCMTIVPGSNSAWRKRVVEEVGLYDGDTLAEDTDMTLKIITRNYRIMYDDRAITYEECPNTIRGFVKQRVRWSYGILQSLWKNRDSIRTSNNKFLKYFAVPNMLITYLLYMTMPIADIVFIIAMFYKQYIVLLFFLFFFMVDTMASVYAFALERESKKPLWLVFIQRLAYRYLFTYIVWKVLFVAVKGTGLDWGKLFRTGDHFK